MTVRSDAFVLRDRQNKASPEQKCVQCTPLPTIRIFGIVGYYSGAIIVLVSKTNEVEMKGLKFRGPGTITMVLRRLTSRQVVRYHRPCPGTRERQFLAIVS
jgi:hypothetical protein